MTSTSMSAVVAINSDRSSITEGCSVILMAPHSHVAPSVQKDADYCEFASARIAAAVERAWNERKVGGVSFGLGHAVVGHNRIATYSGRASLEMFDELWAE